jgi:ABC-2 type transport system permease protein
MIAFANHFAFEFKTGLRNSTSMLMNYLFPLGFYAMMGAVMTKINPVFGDTMIPAMILVAVMAATLLGLPGPLVESREAGIYRSFKINGVPALSILSIRPVNDLPRPDRFSDHLADGPRSSWGQPGELARLHPDHPAGVFTFGGQR